MLQPFVALPVLRLVFPHAALPALEWRGQEAGPPAQVRGRLTVLLHHRSSSQSHLNAPFCLPSSCSESWSWAWLSCRGTHTPLRTAAQPPSTSVTSSSSSVCGWLRLCPQRKHKKTHPPKTNVSEPQPEQAELYLFSPAASVFLLSVILTIRAQREVSGVDCLIRGHKEPFDASHLRWLLTVKEAKVCRQTLTQCDSLQLKRWKRKAVWILRFHFQIQTLWGKCECYIGYISTC